MAPLTGGIGPTNTIRPRHISVAREAAPQTRGSPTQRRSPRGAGSRRAVRPSSVSTPARHIRAPLVDNPGCHLRRQDNLCRSDHGLPLIARPRKGYRDSGVHHLTRCSAPPATCRYARRPPVRRRASAPSASGRLEGHPLARRHRPHALRRRRPFCLRGTTPGAGSSTSRNCRPRFRWSRPRSTRSSSTDHREALSQSEGARRVRV